MKPKENKPKYVPQPKKEEENHSRKILDNIIKKDKWKWWRAK